MADAQAAPSTATEQKYGGAEGADAMYVKLVSSDDHEFYVRREYALTSGTIKAMLSGPGIIYYFKLKSTLNCKMFRFKLRLVKRD
ncbi:unnamed protein product [Echinostoma caproni]|uniref:Skp1_POZ domain-containing protein n=1 Tax=Echinostoma caproni TaxID=27848 RepID=A0A183AGK2_9TREM|nr:unnamed protein product [Echinostoma caproni]